MVTGRVKCGGVGWFKWRYRATYTCLSGGVISHTAPPPPPPPPRRLRSHVSIAVITSLDNNHIISPAIHKSIQAKTNTKVKFIAYKIPLTSAFLFRFNSYHQFHNSEIYPSKNMGKFLCKMSLSHWVFGWVFFGGWGCYLDVFLDCKYWINCCN